jgi:hypothetical protein
MTPSATARWGWSFRGSDIVIPGPGQRVRPEVAGPMTGSARSPESITPAQGVWIPGSPLGGAPE